MKFGQPSNYWPGPTLLNLGDLTRATATSEIWLMHVEIKFGFIYFRSFFRLVQDRRFIKVNFLHYLYQVDQEKHVISWTFFFINNFVFFFNFKTAYVWHWYWNDKRIQNVSTLKLKYFRNKKLALFMINMILTACSNFSIYNIFSWIKERVGLKPIVEDF